MNRIGKDLEKAIHLLREGEIVAIPTETVYGLAANAFNPSAVIKIFQAKNRPQFDPLIVHFPSIETVRKSVAEFPSAAMALAEAFWPGPLTLLLKKQPVIPDLVTAGLSTVAVRCPDHPLTQALLQKLDFPLAAPSANPFGYVSPTRPEHVQAQLGDSVSYILDGGPCSVGVESTIVGWDQGKLTVYRTGGTTIEAIEKVAGEKAALQSTPSEIMAPGQMKSHYATRRRLIIGNIAEMIRTLPKEETAAVLSFSRNYQTRHQYILSPAGDLAEAARNLFTALRTLDALPVTVILAEEVPHEGLGRAINDRLRRASA